MKISNNYILRIFRYYRKLFIKVFGYKSYNKFIIISRSRTGSTFLIQLLNSHPNIVAQGELFLHLNQKSTIEIWNKIFSYYPHKIKYVGFKLFYYHPVDSENKDIWKYILNDKSIKIIHLVRHNMLRTIISRKIANKTSQWHIQDTRDKIKTTEKKVTINIEECIEEFNKIRKWETETRNYFLNHEFFEISYEDLEFKKDLVLKDLLNFMNIRFYKTSSNVQKQNTEKLEELIINYTELKTDLEQTEWAYILKEN